MNTIRPLFVTLVSVAALVSAATASADIGAYNAAVARGDFAAAATAASKAWPDLDKTRSDLPVVAREFAFTATMAKDYIAAKKYAEAALAHSDDPTTSDPFGTANLLIAHADIELAPSRQTRQHLRTALGVRHTLAKADLITVRATDALIAYDVNAARWKDALDSTELGISLTRSGGDIMLPYKHRFALTQNIAMLMNEQRENSRNKKIYQLWAQHVRELAADVERVTDTSITASLINARWESEAWGSSLYQLLKSRGQEPIEESKSLYAFYKDTRLGQLTASPSVAGCHSHAEHLKVTYPASANYTGLIGSVIYSFDVDASGAVTSYRQLAAFPENHFAKAVERILPSLKFVKDAKWDSAACTLESKNRVVAWHFQLSR